MAKGLTNEQLTQALDLQEEKSVKNRIQAILNKMHVKNRTKAAVIATRYGLGEEEARVQGPAKSLDRIRQIPR